MDFGALSNLFGGQDLGNVGKYAGVGANQAAKQGPMGLSALMSMTGGKPLGMGLLSGLLGGQDAPAGNGTPVASPYMVRSMHINMKRLMNPANKAFGQQVTGSQINETDLGSQFENNSSSY